MELSSSKYEVDVILLRILLQAARLSGIEESKVVKYLGINNTCLDLPGSRIPLEHLENAVNYLYQFIKREDLSPLVAKILVVEGLIFQLHVSGVCETSLDYARLAPGIKKVYGDIGELNIVKTGEMLVFSWVPIESESAAGALFGDVFICSSVNFERIFCLDSLMDIEIHLGHSKPKDTKLINSICGENITFDQPETRMYYPDASLNSPRIKSSLVLETSLLKTMDQFIDRENSPDTFLQSVQMAVAQSLPTGRCCIDTVAESLHMSGRTLQRALDKRNTTFQKELQSTRSKLSKKYLKDNQITITQLAFLVGYMDQSSFSTGFKSWFGMTPSEYRKMHSES